MQIREFDPAVSTASGDGRGRADTVEQLDTAELRRRAQDAARRWVDDGESVSTVAQYAHYLDELVTRSSR